MITAKPLSYRQDNIVAIQNEGVTDIDQMLMKSVAQGVVDTQTDKLSVMQKMADAKTISSPETLLDLQQRTADYNLKVSLISTLARKAVGAVETVLRA